MMRTLLKITRHIYLINGSSFNNFIYKTLIFRRPLLTFGAAPVAFAISLLKTSHREDDEEDDIDHVIEEADTFHEHSQVKEGWEVLKGFKETTEPEILWRLARILAEKAKKVKDKSKKKKLYLEALEYVKKALECEPKEGCFGAHKWYAIIINYLGELEGTKSHIQKSYEVKKHLEKALAINPDDAISLMILGFWHFTFADLPSYQRYIAKAIFGTPPSSTYEEALKYFDRVEALKPGYYKPCCYFLGEIHKRLGDNDKAIEFYKQAFNAPIRSRDDEVFHKMVLERLHENGYTEDDLDDKSNSY